jgi:hypothetical protein
MSDNWVNPLLQNRIPTVTSSSYQQDDSTPEITTEQARAYLDRRGGGCPACGDSRIEGGSYHLVNGTIYQPMHCTECGAEWDNCYELDRILDTGTDQPTNRPEEDSD